VRGLPRRRELEENQALIGNRAGVKLALMLSERRHGKFRPELEGVLMAELLSKDPSVNLFY
jgi:hypothetical protein